jgi:N,N'-diacetylchitobiose transport system permease protein
VEIEEAAYVDGASWWRMFWLILFPLVAPGLVATSVFSFITAWNEFIFAITFMSDQDKYTAAAGLREFFTQYGTNWGAVMAGSTLITVPVMLFFVVVQRKLSSGLVAGAVKG